MSKYLSVFIDKWWFGRDVPDGFPGDAENKKSACSTGDSGSVPGLERSSGDGDGSQLQYSYLENSVDRGAWWAVVTGLQRVGHDWAATLYFPWWPSGKESVCSAGAEWD